MATIATESETTDLVLLILRGALSRIAQPAGWCQGFFARDEQGDSVDYMDDRACSWCLKGALYWAETERYADHDPETVFNAADEARDLIRRALLAETDLVRWNDAPERTQGDVVSLLQSIIEYRVLSNERAVA